MYAYISGHLAEKGTDYVVIDAGGVGYRIFTNTHALSNLPSENAKLFTYFVVKENEQSLYGFLTEQEKDMFIKLIGISGVGPKMALSVLTTLTASELAAAIISSDTSAFTPVSGVGKKIAERIILELREKVSSDNLLADIGGVVANNPESEAVNALVSLGYKRAEALKAIAMVKDKGNTTEELILLALKRLG
ncbi:MAG: Holliday junction branch migration protein RuvA [Eubacteriales bacterium]